MTMFDNNYKVNFFIKFFEIVPSAAKYPLLTQGADFLEKNFLRHLDLCYVNPAHHKLKTFSLLKTMNQSEASRNCSYKICHLWGKGYFAAVGTTRRQSQLLENQMPVHIKLYELRSWSILFNKHTSKCSLINFKYL